MPLEEEGGSERQKEPVEADEINKEDWLERRTRFLRLWRKAWCVLDGNTLTWYDGPGKVRMDGRFDVDRCSVTELPGKKKVHPFEVRTREGRSFAFRADSVEKQKEWSKAIKEAGDATNRLLETYKTEDECINCIALATVQEAKEEVIERDEKDDPAEEASMSSIVVKDMEGQEVVFKSIFTQQLAVVALLRHFG